MLEGLFNFIINIFFWLCGLIGSLVIYPIQVLLVTLFPSIGTFITTTLNFFVNQLYPVVSFCKELFLDLSCMPPAVFSILVTFLITKWALAPAIRAIVFVINAYRLLHGGMTINLSHGEKNVFH